MKFTLDIESLKKKSLANFKKINWSPWFRLYGRVLLRIIKDKYFYRASALSFVTLLNIVPLLSVIVSITTHLPVFSRIMDATRKYVVVNFMPNSSDVISEYLETFSHQASGMPTLSILFLFYTVFALARTIQDALSSIWQKERVAKTFWQQTLQWSMFALTPCFMGISIAFVSFIISSSWFETPVLLLVKFILVAVFPVILNTGIFFLFYTAISNYQVHALDRFIGSFTASILFEIGQLGFTFYLAHFDSYHVIYGALAAIPIFFMWLYISWLIVVFGALVIDEHFIREQAKK